MKRTLLSFIVFVFAISALFAQADKVKVVQSDNGIKLQVNGKDFIINGMNWDYFPIGTNYNYSLWKQPDAFIKTALDNEMSLLRNMGVNTIRAYVGIQPKWVKYIYENYGIYTVVNHTFGRYGLNVDGVWIANTDYSMPGVHKLLNKEVTDMVNTYKGTPGILMYMLGNENNYGLFWEGAETEDMPTEQRKSTHKAVALYNMFEEAFQIVKKIDTSIPVAMCNGDALFMDIIAKECPSVDVLGINSYRGISFTDIFTTIKAKYPNKPIMFTEFGADAYNAQTLTEEQRGQALFDLANWKEIYENAAGMGGIGSCIGGFTFQFSDGWWKYKQTTDLDIHNTVSTWVNGGYSYDFVPGTNNMNEEWFGICAKGENDASGHYQLYPRAAYYALQQAHKFNPYAPGATRQSLENHFKNIQIEGEILKARGDKSVLDNEQSKKYSISVRGEITTFNTGGSLITTPPSDKAAINQYPNKLGFDHMESYYLGFDVKPADNVHANVTLNVIGNVASNPIDEIFYENKAKVNVQNINGKNYDMNLSQHIGIYKADFSWNTKWYNLTGFYRTGHFHWGYEGDFFGLYPETNYGPNLDIYHGEAPFGFEMEGNKALKGLKIAFGPELWWGANPAVLVKYEKSIGGIGLAAIFQEDLDRKASSTSSSVQPQPKTRKLTLYAKKSFGKFGVEAGGIWAGSPLIGDKFNIWDDKSERLYQDEIKLDDTWGGKAKITLKAGKLNWYAQGAALGLVATGGADWTKTFTGWKLKDCGSGNQYNVLSGLTYNFGNLQIAPNFLYQKPFVGAVIEGAIDAVTGVIGHSRNIVTDPFSVRANRETLAGELLIAFDPTPATWMWDWDNDIQEDAPFAASLDFVYRHQPTTMDASTGYLADGTAYALAAPAAHDVWEINSHIISKLTRDFGFIVNLLGGIGQPNGPDVRIVKRYGGDFSMIYKKIKMLGSCKVNDWGPYDYHRDYNLTYPLQLMADVSSYVNLPKWINSPDTKIGLRYTYRTLDQYSNRYIKASAENGNEWEIRTYVHFNIGK